MDARPRRCGQSAGRWAAGGTALLLACAACSPAWGQLGILAPPDQSMAHNTEHEPQVFAEAEWQFINVGVTGAVSVFSCGPFAHRSNPKDEIDCQLNLRILDNGGSAQWRVAVPKGRTDVAHGERTAEVAAKSERSGNGSAGLTVTFLNSNFSKLAAGDYSLVVTGTITAN